MDKKSQMLFFVDGLSSVDVNAKYYNESGNLISEKAQGSQFYDSNEYILNIYSRHILTIQNNKSSLLFYNAKVYNQDNLSMNRANVTDETTGLYIPDGKTICFEGQGDLSVTVEPLRPISTIAYTDTSGIKRSMDIKSKQTITIAPDNYKYEDDGNGSYTIKLTCDNVTLSDLQLVDTSDVFEWDKIRMPEMSRWID